MAQDSGLPKKVLIVDDDISVAQRLEKPLKSYGVDVVKAATLEAALHAFEQSMFEVAIVELEFAQMPGLAMIQHWREHENLVKRQTGYIVISGTTRTPGDEQMLKELGDLEFLTKPFSLIQILPFLSRGLARKKKAEKIHDLRRELLAVQMEDNGVEKAVTMIKSKLPQLGSKGLMMMVDTFEQAGMYDQALEVIDAMVARNPSDTAALSRKGDLLKEQGKHSDAISWYEKAHKIAPNGLKRLSNMSESYLETGDAENAIKVMKPLVKLKPFDEDLKFDMFDALNMHGHNKEAVELCRETTSAREVLRYYNNKGVSLSKEGLVREAIEEYKKALRYYPHFKDNFRIMFNIALALVSFKKPDAFAEAETYLTQCLKLAPDFEKAEKMRNQIRKALAASTKNAS